VVYYVRFLHFVDKNEQITLPEDLEPYLIPQKNNVDVQKIVSKLLN
tara:strand:+ start:2689 stop:2826 length:138 start_codon:yes stop_codon:yes gene_type:complete